MVEKAIKQHWLMKSEPSVFSIEDLEKSPGKKTDWDGVRNYQARNYMRDQMKVGDQVFFYHSNAEPSGIAGIAEVSKEAYPDESAFDKKNHHYDPKSDPKNPTWYVVEVKHVSTFPRVISLAELRKVPKLSEMVLLRKGSRLSVQPVSESEWEAVLALVK